MHAIVVGMSRSSGTLMVWSKKTGLVPSTGDKAAEIMPYAQAVEQQKRLIELELENMMQSRAKQPALYYQLILVAGVPS